MGLPIIERILIPKEGENMSLGLPKFGCVHREKSKCFWCTIYQIFRIHCKPIPCNDYRDLPV